MVGGMVEEQVVPHWAPIIQAAAEHADLEVVPGAILPDIGQSGNLQRRRDHEFLVIHRQRPVDLGTHCLAVALKRRNWRRLLPALEPRSYELS